MSVEISAIIKTTVTMRNTVGPISVPGVKVGDKVIGGWSMLTGQWYGPGTYAGGGLVEAFVSVDDELQVVYNGLGTASYDFILVR